MRLDLRPLTAVGILLAVLLSISGGSVVTADFADVDVDGASAGAGVSERSVDTVVLEDGTELWPYTSRAPSHDEQTLSINLVVYGDTSTTSFVLRESAVGEWAELEEEQQDVAPAEDLDVNATRVAWGAADGSTRYVYVEPPDGSERWMSESYQLADGDYLGARHHIRAYEDPVGENWTAIQAHQEHWDWFHLRHTVQSSKHSQSYVEAEFIDQWYVDDLYRERFGNDRSSDADGWVTVVKILSGIVALSLGGDILRTSAPTTSQLSRVRTVVERLHRDDGVRITARSLLVVVSIVALFASIRFGAIGLERHVVDRNPKIVVAAVYPLLVVGLPVVAYVTARPLDVVPAFAAGSIGLVVATFVDYTYLGVVALPIDTFVHRVALAVAIGLIAAGASQTARSPGVELGHVRSGVLLWVVAIVLPLLQFV